MVARRGLCQRCYPIAHRLSVKQERGWDALVDMGICLAGKNDVLRPGSSQLSTPDWMSEAVKDVPCMDDLKKTIKKAATSPKDTPKLLSPIEAFEVTIVDQHPSN